MKRDGDKTNDKITTDETICYSRHVVTKMYSKENVLQTKQSY